MPARPLSRRTTVGSALLLPLVVSACDIDPPVREDASGEVVPEPPEDSALVASVVAAVSAAADVVAAASDVTPALAARLDGLARDHAAHLDLLVGAVPDADVPSPGAASVAGATRPGTHRRTPLRAAPAPHAAPVVRGSRERRPGPRAGEHRRVGLPARRHPGPGAGAMTVLEALQTTLSDEHAAVYTYGVLGARTSQSDSPALSSALDTGYRQHRSRRDQLRLMIDEAGGTPVVAEPAYELRGRLLQPAAIEAAALALEEASTVVLLALVAQSAGTVREWALTEAIWSATWGLELGGEPQTWPGAPELG